MANNYLTPNMSLVIPVPGQEPGPDWASDINSSLTILDGHTHAPGSGVLITPAAININADLVFNDANNATDLRSVRFFPNPSALGLAADIGCLYEAGVDLYYNDGAGNQIRITQSGNVAGSSGTITGLPSGTASASYQSITGTFQFQQATSTAANLDVGSVIIRYPGSYPVPSGNAIILEAPSSLSSLYALTLPALPAQTNVMTLGTGGIISSTTWDTVGQNMTSAGANAIQAVTTRSTGTTVGIGGVGISTSCGVFTTNSTSPGSVTNLTVTITSSGRPLHMQMIGDGSGSSSSVKTNTSTTSTQIYFYRDTTQLCKLQIDPPTSTSGVVGVPVSAFSHIDAVGAGTYTYSVNFSVSGGIAVATLSHALLVVYEL